MGDKIVHGHVRVYTHTPKQPWAALLLPKHPLDPDLGTPPATAGARLQRTPPAAPRCCWAAWCRACVQSPAGHTRATLAGCPLWSPLDMVDESREELAGRINPKLQPPEQNPHFALRTDFVGRRVRCQGKPWSLLPCWMCRVGFGEHEHFMPLLRAVCTWRMHGHGREDPSSPQSTLG